LSSLLADFVCLCLPGPQQRLYRCQNNAGERAMVCRDCCDHWQVVLMLFVMIIPKIDFSLFVVLFLMPEWMNGRDWMLDGIMSA
jgi:hypothetical protein